MKNGYGHRYRLAPLFFFSSFPRLLSKRGKKKPKTQLAYMKLLVCFRKWDGDPTACRWPDVKKYKKEEGKPWGAAPIGDRGHTKVSAPATMLCYYNKEAPRHHQEHHPPLLVFFFFFYMRRSLIESMSECLRRIDGATRERKWSVVWISIDRRKERQAPCFFFL